MNLEVSRLAKRLTEAAGIDAPQRPDGTERWWNVIATGPRSEGGRRFFWKLRPQVYEAAWQLGLVDVVQDQFPDEVQPLVEGATVRVTVNAYERNPVARRRCVEHHGVACAVCSIQFERVYGSVAAGVIHVHHLVPLAEGSGEPREVDPVEDLRPVCPNCHVVIHRRSPPYSIEEMKSLMKEQAGSPSRQCS